MSWNSIVVRIWVPFLASALTLLYFLAVHVPNLQQKTLRKFYLEKLQIEAEALGNVVKQSLDKEDFVMLADLTQMYRDSSNASRLAEAAVFSEDEFGTSVFGVLGSWSDPDHLTTLMDEDVSLERIAEVVKWEGSLPAEKEAFLHENQIPNISFGEFKVLMDTSLLYTKSYISEADLAVTFVAVGDKAAFEAELADLRDPFFILQTFLALGAIALFYYLAFHISRPIVGVAAVAEEMRQGNFEVEIEEVSSLNEMGALTHALRELRDDLLKKRRENNELTNDMERKIVERTEQLEVALQAKDEFLSTMSHEIRTPLHSLIAIADMLRREEDHGQREDLLKSLSTSSKQLLALINDILDFSKISAGQLELHLEPVPLRQFFEELSAPFEVSVKPGVEFVKSWPDRLENRVVEADAMRLSQILHNLLSNAFKFTEQGEVILGVRCKEVDLEGRPAVGLEVQVVDTGVGIAPENVDDILKAFTQENSSISRKFGGTGLGLSIVNRLLHLMGSELEVQSTLGQGSMFGFYLKLPLTQQVTAVSKDSNEEVAVSLDQLRLLYVEDMEPNRFVMKAMVKPWSVQLDMAESGQRAVELVAEKEYDLVLMDIQMPEMDGVETLRQIRSRLGTAWKTPVVAFTAHAQDKEAKKYKAEGFADVLTKPTGPDALKSFLHQFVVNK
ncbi:MAG: ATP-binding protein [Flavobacteriales bacterium]